MDFGATIGSEQAGRRPALVVSSDMQNQYSPIVIVAALSTTIPKKQYPFTVYLPAGQPLDKEGTVFCHQLRTLSKERLIAPSAGALVPEQIEEVDSALKVSLALQ